MDIKSIEDRINAGETLGLEEQEFLRKHGSKPDTSIDTSIEKRQVRLQKNSEERERYMTKLFRCVTRLRQLEAERKRLLGPGRKSAGKPRRMTLEEIRARHAASGYDFNDEIPS